MHHLTLRQILIVTGLIVCCFSEGYIFGQMSGMIDDLHSNNKLIKLSDDEVSWIASIINVICFCCFGLMTIVAECLGRRKSLTISMIPVIISWIMVYFAKDKTTLVISRITAGLSFGGIMFIAYICIGEYIPPNVRPLYLNVTITFGMNAGTMMGHILSTLMHWRYVALIGIIPSTLAAILPLFWVESPSWLATRGRLNDCERAFRCLHIQSTASDKELKLLMDNQKSKVNERDNCLRVLVRKSLEALRTMYFWKLLLLILIIVTYRTVAGRIFFSTFAITIIKDITQRSTITNFTLFADGFMLVGTLISCLLVAKFKLRHLILITGTIANIIQIFLVVCLYIWQDRYDYIIWFKVTLIALYLIIVNAGPYAVMDTLLSEIFPLDIKGFLLTITGIIGGVLQFLCIKLAPHMFVTIGFHGVLLLNAVIVFVCLMYLYKYLPETKGRTLQEIESYFKYNTFEAYNEEIYPLDETRYNLNGTENRNI